MNTAAQARKELEATLEDDMFGEDIVYTQDGVEYPIRGKVYRHGIRSQSMRYDRDTESQISEYDIEVRISNNPDTTLGIPSVNLRSDTVDVARRLGESLRTMRVMATTEQDLGSWKLGLQA